MTGIHVVLRAPEQSVYGDVHRLLNGSGARTWRLRGRFVPSYEVEKLLADATINRLVYRKDGAIAALCQVHDFQPMDGHAQFSVLAERTDDPLGLAVEGALLAMQEAFVRLQLRKLYLHMSDSSFKETGALLRRYAACEGVLRQHLFLEGEWQDVTILAFEPESLMALLSRPSFERLRLDGMRARGLEYEPV